MSTTTGNLTYNLTAMSKEDILQNHNSVMLSFGISLSEKDIALPELYWNPKLHKNPYKQRYIAGSPKCSTETSFSEKKVFRSIAILHTPEVALIRCGF